MSILSEIQKMELDNIPEKNRILVKHSAEISVNSIEIFCNYVFIDDLWIEKNETLAKSIVSFGSNCDF